MTIPHTSGPWTVHPYLRPDLDDDPMGVYVVEEAKDKLTGLYFDTEPDDGPESEAALAAIHAENAANACLLGAAPELKQAIQRMMAWAGELEELVRAAYKWTDEDKRLSDEAFRVGHTAIAHSEGSVYKWVEEDKDA